MKWINDSSARVINFEMHVWAGGAPRRPYVTDNIAFLNLAAFSESGHVQDPQVVPIAQFDPCDVAWTFSSVWIRIFDVFHGSVRGSADGSACRRGDVTTGV